MTRNSRQELDDQKAVYRQLYKESLFFILAPIVGAIIIKFFGGELTFMFFVGAMMCFSIPMFGFFWVRYHAKKNHASSEKNGKEG